MKDLKTFPDSCFIVLSILSEGEVHGYDLEKMVFNRGFRFWTQLGRSSIYNSLRMLEKSGLVKTKLQEGGGPTRKVFAITKPGLQTLKKEGYKHLANPAHWRSEIDLGIYALPLLDQPDRQKAISETLERLQERVEFINERLKWCRDRKLELPALTFERTAVMLEAEIQWLKNTFKKIGIRPSEFSYEDWQNYEYREPPKSDLL
jgi:DNA-binding PadR family transcriptional regulator